MSGTKWVILLVLSTLLCVYPVHSLHCYHCRGVKQLGQCYPAQCPASTIRCGSIEATDKNGPEKNKLHFKGCSNSSCAAFFQEIWKQANSEIPESVMNVRYTCCSKELCNVADGIRGSPLALIGAFLLSLGSVFLWAIS